MHLLSDHLLAFLAVAEAHTTYAAAKKLHLTQTAVTRRIANLEHELKSTLFIRSRRGMELTPAGVAVLRFCQSTKAQEGEVLAQLKGDAQSSHVVIQGPSSIIRSRVIPQLTPILKQLPQVSVEFQIRDISDGVTALKNGHADLVIVNRLDVVREFDSKVLHPERYILVGPKAWQKRSIADIVKSERIIDFDPNDEMTFSLLTKLKLRPSMVQRHFVNNTDALADMIHRGLGYSVLSEAFLDDIKITNRYEFAIFKPEQKLDVPIALAWYPQQYLPNAFSKMIHAMK